MSFKTDWPFRTRFRADRCERAAYVSGAALFLAVALLVIVSIDPSNPESGEVGHTGPVPAGVTTLAPDEYFIGEGSSATVQDICLGGYHDRDGNLVQVEQSSKVPGHGTVVRCAQDQRWNVRRDGGEDITYPQAVARQAQHPVIAAFLGLAALVSLGIWAAALPDLFEWRRDRRANRLTDEQRLRELNRALGEDTEFTASMYDEALRKLYRLGIKPAKD